MDRRVRRGLRRSSTCSVLPMQSRYLLAVLVEAVDGRDFVVTAREMTDSERQAFRRKRR